MSFGGGVGRVNLKDPKKAWKYDAGAGLLKRGELALFLFNFFKAYRS